MDRQISVLGSTPHASSGRPSLSASPRARARARVPRTHAQLEERGLSRNCGAAIGYCPNTPVYL